MDTKGSRYFHRVLDSALAAWVRLGWSVVREDRDSGSLAAQGQHAYLIEWTGNGEPRTP
jgi:hypothetical protein